MNTTLNLIEGWNLIPVISNCGVKVEDLFDGISLVVIKGIASNLLYWPEFGIESLSQLMPGSAYMVLMAADENVVFPSCDKGFDLSLEHKLNSTTLELTKAAEISGKPELTQTPNTHTIAIPVSAFSGIDIAVGDVIEAFDGSNQCYGLASWKDEALAITLFGDDQSTASTDGFGEMSPIFFKVFRPSTSEEFSLEAVWDMNFPEHDGLFVSNGISAIAGFKLKPAGIYSSGQSEIQLYPNPAKDQLTIQYSFDGEAELSIYNLQGLKLVSLTLNGRSTELNTSMLLPGTYLVKISGRNTSSLQRLIIQ
jgi:hypothetical protein